MPAHRQPASGCQPLIDLVSLSVPPLGYTLKQMMTVERAASRFPSGTMLRTPSSAESSC